jgi:hypothetical protein
MGQQKKVVGSSEKELQMVRLGWFEKGGLVLVTVKASWGRRIYCGRLRSHQGWLEPEYYVTGDGV